MISFCSYYVSPVLDFPGADTGKFGGEHVGRPFVAEHDGVLGWNLVLLHGFGEFLTHGFLGPPDAVDFDGLAEFLHHFLAAVVADDYDFHAGFFAVFDPILEFVGGFFLGMEPQGVIEIAQKEIDVFFF